MVGSKVGGVLQIAWECESVIECSGASVVYREDFADLSFLCYHRSVRRNANMRIDAETGVVIHGGIRIC